ncbi:MAG: protein kinase, partial [Candidatus Krumholzibacteriia bacterium]
MIGRRFAHYEILEKNGQGGMGEVFRARDTRLERDVALKFLPPEFAADPERLARFRNEAKTLAVLNHPNIAAIYGLEQADGKPFLAMEYVGGEEVAQRVRRGPLERDEALELARQFTEGLEAAHERGIVHRDLKPANLKITPEGQLKILDFGLARAFVEDTGEPGNMLDSPTLTAALTQKGVILGTAAYMSPEQARGRKVDHRADIWAFGAILYEMLSGQRLFTGETISDTVAAVLRADLDLAALPADTPVGVRRLLLRCLERDTRRRLRDIGEARVRLERWRDDPDTIFESASLLDARVALAPPRRALVPWLVAGTAVAAAVVMGALLLTARPAPPRLSEWAVEVTGEERIDPKVRQNVLISPDGNWYGWQTLAGIHLRRLDAPQVRLLPGTAEAIASGFSPDSRWIAFITRGGLHRISVDSGAPFRICDASLSRGLAWVDEGTIVMSDGIATGLKRVDLESGEVTAVTAPDSTGRERSHRWPTAVPGRRGVLFECQYVGRDYDQSDIQYLDLDSGQRHTVHRGGAMPLARRSGHLLFVRGRTIYARRLDLQRMEAHGQPLAVREGIATSVGNQEDDDGSAQYTLDDEGNLFCLDMMGAAQERSQLAWLDLADASIEPISGFAAYGAFRIAPDGRKLVTSLDRDGDANLYVLDLDAGTELLLTTRPSLEYIGAWSPDSRRFYWTQSSDDGSRYEIWSRLVDGSQPAQHVATPPNQGGGIWIDTVSPDNRWLGGSFFAGGDRNDLFTVDLGPAEPVDAFFVGGPESQFGMSFLDQGQYVIYGSGDF